MGAQSEEAANPGPSDAAGGERDATSNPQRRAHLERVLRDALLKSDDLALAARERAALREVASRHAGEPLSFEPVMKELVGALIGVAFNVRVEESPTCLEMSRMIARSLWDDTVIRDRVEALWRDLMEHSQ